MVWKKPIKPKMVEVHEDLHDTVLGRAKANGSTGKVAYQEALEFWLATEGAEREVLRRCVTALVDTWEGNRDKFETVRELLLRSDKSREIDEETADEGKDDAGEPAKRSTNPARRVG